MRNITLQQEIINLTQIWYKIVSLDHHKDRDCHWVISTEYSYGQKPFYRVEHYGYIGKEVNEICETYDEAENFLANTLSCFINDEKRSAEKVIKNKNVYEKFDVKKAHEILKIINDKK